MSVNSFRPHMFVLPEDDANRQLANGFVLNLNARQIQILPEAGGWLHVCREFRSNHVHAMRLYDVRLIVLLVDFDDDLNRLKKVQDEIPDDLSGRVFVLGVRTEPEALKRAKLGSYEAIGREMADSCRDGTHRIWAHELLRHNEGQLRLLRQAAPFLF